MKRTKDTRAYTTVGRCTLRSTLSVLDYPDPNQYAQSAAVADLIEKWWAVTRAGVTDGTCHAGFVYKTDNIVSLHILVG
jgi:hypothetical protein